MTHTLRRMLPLLILPIGLAGCSSTKGNRLALAPDFKTVATVGDQPIVAVTGEPGDSVQTDLPTTPNRDNPKARISGRVVDSSGEPVPNATVRLADGSSGGGKVVEAVTDRAGGFTLRGLRPGGRYTLIAEVDDGRIVTSGRAEAKSSATNVEISLNDRDPDAPPAPKAPRPRSVSTAQQTYDDEPARPARRRVNEDDLPPAEPADDLATRTSAKTSDAANRVRRAAPGNGWVGTDGRTTAAGYDPGRDEEALSRAKAPAPRSMEAIPEEDDVPNPLPPALEPEQEEEVQVAPTSRRTSQLDSDFPAPSRVAARKPQPQPYGPRGDFGPSRVASDDEGPNDGLATFVMPGAMRPAAKVATPREAIAEPEGEPVRRFASATPEAPSAPAEEEEGPNPLPPALEVSEVPTLTASTPTAPTGAQPGDVAPPEIQAAASPSPAAAPPESVPPPEWVTDLAGAGRDSTPGPKSQVPAPTPTPVAVAESEEANPLPPALPERKKTTWAQLASINPPDAISDRVSRSSAAPRNSMLPPVERDLPAGAQVAESVRSEPARNETPRPATARPEPAVAPASRFEKATILYDPRAKRVSDFTLPDLQGQMVKLSEFDSEYVLLDFWGTWCKPCLSSVPKLVEMQKKFGPEKLQIVGIACEESPIPQRAGKVSEVAERLNINYAVLLSGMDGRPCPLQQALGVTAFPTMVLLDRKGNVVWRDSGNSAASLTRLDRIVQSGTARSTAGVARR